MMEDKMSAKTFLTYDSWYGNLLGTYDNRQDAEKDAKMASVRKDRPISIYLHDKDVVAKVIEDKIYVINV